MLLGTVFPLVREAFSGVRISVGAPYFNRMALPLGVAILFLMGVGPSLPWGRASPETLRRQFLVPAGVGVAVVIVCVAAGLRGSADAPDVRPRRVRRGGHVARDVAPGSGPDAGAG